LTSAEQAKLANTPSVRVAIIALNDIETWLTNSTETTPGGSYFDANKFLAEVTKAKNELSADIIVVIPHWGFEYQTTPDQKQIDWAHLFIDNGADLVVGGHPHVIQPSEEYRGKMIYYSLGNFVFDNMYDAADGQMLSVEISASMGVDEKKPVIKLGEQKLIDIRLDDKGFPELSTK
jgi:poly-gamma-glutamate synthesis protein (capsule biosynthesis protein)